MEQIEIKSNWLAFALGARNNKITLEELHNTRILDFNLLEYIRGNSDVYFSEVQDRLSEEQIISETSIFMSELSRLQEYADFNIERIGLNGLNFRDTNLNNLYSMIELKELILEDNTNCNLELSKLQNIKEMDIILVDCQTKEVDVSDYTKNSIGLPYIPTEYDLYKATRKESFSDNNIDISDLQTIDKYTISRPTISIKDISDIKQINKMRLNDISIGLRTGEIRNLVELSQLVDHVIDLISRPTKNIHFNQVIDNVSELSLEQLQVIQEKMSNDKDFDSVKVLKYMGCYEQYNLQTYQEIRARIDELIENIDLNSPDIDKFLSVQDKIIYNIAFDQKAEKQNVDWDYFRKHEISSRNLEDGLLCGRCVCAGYADILRNMLGCVNIDSTFVKGTANGNGHAWNQVKLGYDWYNTDITADRYNIIKGNAANYCLKSDIEFYKGNAHKVNNFDRTNVYLKQCDRSYNPNIIKTLSENRIQECQPEVIIDTVEGMQKVDGKEYSILFARSEDNYLQVGVAEQSEGGILAQATKMCIDKDNIGNFVRTYLKRYEEQCKGKNNEEQDLTYISAQNGVGLIIGPNTRKRLYEEGIVDVRTDTEKEKYNEKVNKPVGVTREESIEEER